MLHNFSGLDGSLPSANLVFSGSGTLYGTTAGGGTAGNNGGTVFQMTPPSVGGGTWAESVLYSLPSGRAAPGTPTGAVTVSPTGVPFTTARVDEFTTSAGGGTVFMLAPPGAPGESWTEYTLLNFAKNAFEGEFPAAGVLYTGGSLYGTTASYCGSVYELSPPASGSGPWASTSIHNFSGSDGCGSLAALTLGPGGVLYGTTAVGGVSGTCIFPDEGGCGTVFQLTPPTTPGGSWTETVIYSFTAANGDGGYPSASVVLGANGVLYGTTQYGGIASSPCSYYGAFGCGTVFQLTPPTTPGGVWTEAILHTFSGQNGDGSIPIAGLTLSPSGTLYGTTSAGGNANKGTVFSVTP